MPAAWDDIQESIRLEEVLSELGYLTSHISRGEHFASCILPSHPGGDRSPSFSINQETLLWHCFTCDRGGLLPQLVSALHEFEDDLGSRDDPPTGLTAFQKGVQWLIPFSDGEPDTDQAFLNQVQRYLELPVRPPAASRVVTLPYFTPRVLQGLRTAPEKIVAKWGLLPQTRDEFDLRHDPERSRFKAGQTYTGPALIIPHRFHGDLVGYQERWLDRRDFEWLDCDRPHWMPKYTNTDDFPKAETLFGYDRALAMGVPPIVVESVMTVMRLFQLGYAAVATFGRAVRPEQLRLLRTFHCGVWLAFDNDKPGQGATQNCLEALVDHIPVEVIPPPAQEKGDLADVAEDEVHGLVDAREPGFLVRANPKLRG